MTQFNLADIFTDNMVVQRGKPICIFGTGETGSKIAVSLGSGASAATVTDGTWKLFLPAVHEYRDDLTLIAECSTDNKTIILMNIAVGEVWFAGGQSNMEWELQSCEQGEQALANDYSPNIRYYYTPKTTALNRENENTPEWEQWGSEGCKHWSAAAYFFAKKITHSTGAIVGIIGCNWGGTSASAWVSRECLTSDTNLKRLYIDQHTPADYEPCKPTQLYESMVKPICPYTIAGFIWYQGEADCIHAEHYYTLFSSLISLWRKDWEDSTLPFLFCQLTMHRFEGDPDWKDWAVLREAQDKVNTTTPDTGIAVIVDCGEFNEVHPKDKKTVGERLSLLALRTVYNKDVKAFAPRYRSHAVKNHGNNHGNIPPTTFQSHLNSKTLKSGREIELYFDNADEGFALKNSDYPVGFELAGADGVFYDVGKGLVEFDGENNKIVIKSNEVERPHYIRYLWTNYAEVISIYGADSDLPLIPFRAELY